jgi:hypothetical protein
MSVDDSIIKMELTSSIWILFYFFFENCELNALKNEITVEALND